MTKTKIHRIGNLATQAPPRPIRVLALRAVDGAGGGADKIVLRNAASVKPDAVRMAICFMHRPDDPEFDLADRSAQLGIQCYDETHRGPFDREIFQKLRKVTRDFQPDIIHSHDYKASFIASYLSRQDDTLLRLATSHGWTGDKWRERQILYPADRLLLRSFPGIIAVSNQIRDTLVRWGANPDRVRVVLNGIDTDEFQRDEQQRIAVRRKLGFTSDEIVLGAAGRVERQKRFDLLVEAFDQLRRTDSRLRLVIAGEGSRLAPLQQDVVRRGLQDHCKLLGHCSDMIETYHAFDMLVQSSDYEGTPTVVVEAMALQIPVVATDAGGTAQLIRDKLHGRVVPTRDVPALCHAIQQTIADRAQTDRQVRAARRRAESDLSYQRRTEQLQAIYQELVTLRRLEPA